MGYRSQIMTMATKHEVIKDVLKEYLRASKEEKGVILDRLEKTVGMHRKTIVRRFRVLQTRKEGYDWSDTRGEPCTTLPMEPKPPGFFWACPLSCLLNVFLPSSGKILAL